MCYNKTVKINIFTCIFIVIILNLLELTLTPFRHNIIINTRLPEFFYILPLSKCGLNIGSIHLYSRYEEKEAIATVDKVVTRKSLFI